MKHVKENDLAHGQFGKWLESIGMNHRVANQIMKVTSELGDEKWRTSSNLGMEALYQIATLPPDQRDKPHVIPSTGEVKTVDEMTVRELREVKRAQMVVFFAFSYLYKRRVDAYYLTKE